jgi:hypothetical protein
MKEALVIRLDIEEPTDDSWREWRERCQQETQKLIASVKSGERREIKSSLYGAQKKALFDLYNNKCAYCESPFTRYPGDLDHYRPKNRVMDENNEPVRVKMNGKESEHTGYYWLAYDWRNLLPSCEHCNRPNTGSKGKRMGKWDRFPVKGFRAWKPGDEKREHALLLNPISDKPENDPTTHLEFDDTGVVGGSSEEAEETIELLGLNDDPLIEERREAYRVARDAARRFFDALGRNPNDEQPEGIGTCEAAIQGRARYSAVARRAIADCKAAILAGFKRLKL